MLDLTLCRNGTQIDFLAVDENFVMQGFINLETIKTIKSVSIHVLPVFHGLLDQVNCGVIIVVIRSF